MDMHDCYQRCHECAQACEQTVNHYLSQTGTQADPEHIRLLLDCVDICLTSAAFLARGSERHTLTCAACASVCELCAKACEAMDDRQMKTCAEICHACADSCRQMADRRRTAA